MVDVKADANSNCDGVADGSLILCTDCKGYVNCSSIGFLKCFLKHKTDYHGLCCFYCDPPLFFVNKCDYYAHSCVNVSVAKS